MAIQKASRREILTQKDALKAKLKKHGLPTEEYYYEFGDICFKTNPWAIVKNRAFHLAIFRQQLPHNEDQSMSLRALKFSVVAHGWLGVQKGAALKVISLAEDMTKL